MKKSIHFVLLAVLCFSLLVSTACGGDSPVSSDTGTTDPTVGTAVSTGDTPPSAGTSGNGETADNTTTGSNANGTTPTKNDGKTTTPPPRKSPVGPGPVAARL